ncbi:histone H3 K4-specific methyltransferase SET7/9 family protein [Actinidia rufa]|uniref:Histone H3 K4-specific methyltransferase SET7/9 family protein n=1 Tax=Actinidia rufa TaxID=165716 RepID=A0A7J0EHF1_9ERIC|nr:histone H3 K4-specific methyltransferase SET7/9 family protein [Actinidia rufa]
MDGQKSQAKLTRTQSSLLRSSPTVRSSIHSISSVNEITPEQEDIEEQKPHKRGSSPVRRSPTRFVPFIAIFSLSLYTLFLYFQRDDIPTSENLLLALIFVAVALFFAGKNKGLIQLTLAILRNLCFDYAKKLGFSKNNHKPVQWFIGESTLAKKDRKNQKEKAIVREGVEFYSNGDFYEGEFHNGRCNGSGVYHYFVNGRYEGDWVDGKYDGYGIEGWARGSRYRGQYRQGLRHGYGVYRFYTGDSYAGKWCNGQSHGVGVQTCSDGSCYVGEFKCGVKHGLGCYHFRNGDRYAGEYFGDLIHGFGVYHFANGHCYEGAWHEGRKQGYGSYTFRNRETRCGEWDCGKLKTPLPPLCDVVLRAVQAARKNTENAIHVRRADEQVNMAVIAANRAATAARVAAVKAVQNRMEGKFCDTDI